MAQQTQNDLGGLESPDVVHVLVACESADGVTGVADAMLFESLPGELSPTFIRITSDKIDREIEAWLGRVVLAMGFDRGWWAS
jgi:hypothetical protein